MKINLVLVDGKQKGSDKAGFETQIEKEKKRKCL